MEPLPDCRLFVQANLIAAFALSIALYLMIAYHFSAREEKKEKK